MKSKMKAGELQYRRWSWEWEGLRYAETSHLGPHGSLLGDWVLSYKQWRIFSRKMTFFFRFAIRMGCSMWANKFSSVTWLCPTLCNPMDCSMPGLAVHHQHLEIAQTHVHRVSDAFQPFHLLLSPSPPVCLSLFPFVSPSIGHEVMGADTMILVFWTLSFKLTFSTFILWANTYLVTYISKLLSNCNNNLYSV